MAKFRYSMQSILEIKCKMETQAKQSFASARAALDEEEDKLKQLCQRKKQFEEQAAQLRSGILDFRKMQENENAISCMEQFIAQQKVQIEKAKQRLERERLRLTEVMMERKTHETLREKAFQQFLQEENKQESKEVDELTSYVYGQKGSHQTRQHATGNEG